MAASVVCRPQIPRLIAISDRSSLPDHSLADWLRRIEGLIDAVQLREKQATDLELLELAILARSSTAATVLVNGRPDIALAANCHGVHLPSSGLPISALRATFGDRLLIGRSTHRPQEVAAAQHAGADYVIFGPVYPTPSKASYGPPPGLDGLRRASAFGLPTVAVGGIGPNQMAEVADAGAVGVAGIRALQNRATVELMAREARRLWPRAAPTEPARPAEGHSWKESN